MAQFNFAEKSEIEELHIEPTDVMTGDRNKSRYLLYQLKLSMARAKQIDIIVSFLMESGVRMLLSDLKAALQRGVRIRILTGNYLGITQPSALYLLKKELGNKVELRFYSDKGRSFHPKSYIFHYDNMSEIYIGSSNISRSALTSGIEWNYRFNSKQDSQNFKLFYETFEDLFKNHSYVIDDAELKAYSKNWHKPAVTKDLARYDQTSPPARISTSSRSLRRTSSTRGCSLPCSCATTSPTSPTATSPADWHWCTPVSAPTLSPPGDWHNLSACWHTTAKSIPSAATAAGWKPVRVYSPLPPWETSGRYAPSCNRA